MSDASDRAARNKAETERLLAMLPAVREQLMRLDGVTKVTVGARERGGRIEEEFVFRAHVREKLPDAEVPAGQRVPAEIAGVPTDVVVERMPEPEVGFGDEDDWRTYSPKVGGSRIGAEVAGGTGTLGCLCTRTDSDSTVLLTNWHVLIDPGGSIGDGVGHPRWRKSCCCTCGKIAEVLDFDETLDCAIAELDSGVDFAPKIRRIVKADGTTELDGLITAGAAPSVLDLVWKVGARTGLTRGIISDLDEDEIEVTPSAPFTRMSNKGDSGSVYVTDPGGVVCGLHHSGDGTLAFGTPFDKVMTAMKIEVIPSDPTVAYTVSDTRGRAERTHRPAPYADLISQLRATPGGRELLALFEAHREELHDLIEHDRRFGLAWQRAQGPAYLAALARSAREPGYLVPAEIAGISRADAVRMLAEALAGAGSPALLADLRQHGTALGALAVSAGTVGEFADEWEGRRLIAG